MMTLCNWLRRVFAQKTSNLESITGYRTTKEGFGIYPTRNKSLIFILRTTPHRCRCCRASKTEGRRLPAQHLAHTSTSLPMYRRYVSEDTRRRVLKPLIIEL